MRWKTDDVELELLSICNCTVLRMPPGGDVDTTNLVVSRKSAKDYIYVSGFNVESDIVNPDDTEVEMVEITDGLDSSGGLNSDDPETIMLYAQVRIKMKDFKIVNCMKDYF